MSSATTAAAATLMLLAGVSYAAAEPTFAETYKATSSLAHSGGSARSGTNSVNWVEARDRPTVFVSDPTAGRVNGYSQRTGRLTEQISGLSGPYGAGPYGLATDGAGNLYVADSGEQQVVVFPSGSTTPSLVLAVYPTGPLWAVAVSNKGEVAVAAGRCVYFFRKGATKPFNTVSEADPPFVLVAFAAYDGKGNLYIDGGGVVGEIVGGGRGTAVTIFNLAPSQNVSGGLAVDTHDHLLVTGSSSQSIFEPDVYQYQLPNPTTPSRVISLPNYFIYSGLSFNDIAIALTSDDGAFYVSNGYTLVNSREVSAACRFPYQPGSLSRQPCLLLQYVAGGVAVIPEAAP